MERRNAFVGNGSCARLLRAGLSCGTALALLACGGGGGGGGDAPDAPSATALVITSANAPAVAAEALETSTSTDAASAAGQFITGVQVDGAGSGGSHPALLASATRALLARPRPTGMVAAGAVVSEACSGGGTVTVDANTSGAPYLVAGDAMVISASNCTETVDGASLVMNGSMSITITGGVYDPSSPAYPKSVTLRVVAGNFSIGASGLTEVFDGDLSLALTETSAGSGTLTATAASLSSTVGAHRITLGDYRLQVDQTSTGAKLTVSANVETNNSRLGSTPVRYSLATAVPITVSISGAVTAGSIRVSGASSSLVLNVTGTDTFSLQVDTNGDGAMDSNRAFTLADLQALN